ncbi:MAG: hypothetical protein CMH26_00325 [Micavibrio sp.]|nr:hypothetical protein [Micavibrio sp.]
MNKIYELDPQHLARLYEARKWSDLWAYIISIFDKIHGFHAEYFVRTRIEEDYEDPSKRQLIIEFSKLMSEFLIIIFNDDKTQMDDQIFYKLLRYHEAIHVLFGICNYSDTDPLVQKMLTSQNSPRVSPEKQKAALLLLDIGTKLNIDEICQKTLRKYYIPFSLALLGYSRMDGRAYDNKIELLSVAKKIEDLAPIKGIFPLLSEAYFHVSYLDYAHKHDVKKSFNAYTKAFTFKEIIKKPAIRKAIEQGKKNKYQEGEREKPRMIFFPEHFKKDHAMYRSWGKRMRSMKEKFDVYLMISDENYDASMKEEYPNIIVFNNSRADQAIIKIYELAPDILFYPAVGMTGMGIVLSNIRFCDVQIMGLGHPATTMSNEIDFVLMHKDFYSPKAFPNDCVILDEMPSAFTLHKTLEARGFSIPQNTGKKEHIEISIVGMHFKLTKPFLEILKQIVDEADFEVRPTFILSGMGFGHIYLKELLTREFPNCTIKGYQLYDDYIKSLEQMDIMLCPFPFGHSNTIFDTLMIGKPCISLYGEQAHSRTEAVILDIAGIKDDFVTYSYDEYKKRFFEVAEKIMQGQTTFYEPKEVYEKLNGRNTSYDYAGAMYWIYENADKLKKLKKPSYEAFSEDIE